MNIKKYGYIVWILLLIGVCLWITGGDIISVISGFGIEILKFIGCALLFLAICFLFPKSWFAKIFKNML